ncbi:MAG: DNA-binding protein [Candidatus Omnitrophota bacterium]|nr:DNA-binding protein [Candidatus Omnitrophota bacterium]
MSNAQRKAHSAKRTRARKPLIFIYWVFTLCAMPYALCEVCYAKSISSTELINNAKKYDIKIVSYEGEAIGDVMVRGTYAWINVNDGSNAIGIWIPLALAKNITYTGSYKYKGDWITVDGIFYRSCPEHGGDLDIHARTIKILKKGLKQEETVSSFKVKMATILFVVCLVVVTFYFVKIRYKRKI